MSKKLAFNILIGWGLGVLLNWFICDPTFDKLIGHISGGIIMLWLCFISTQDYPQDKKQLD